MNTRVNFVHGLHVLETQNQVLLLVIASKRSKTASPLPWFLDSSCRATQSPAELSQFMRHWRIPFLQTVLGLGDCAFDKPTDPGSRKGTRNRRESRLSLAEKVRSLSLRGFALRGKARQEKIGRQFAPSEPLKDNALNLFGARSMST